MSTDGPESMSFEEDLIAYEDDDGSPVFTMTRITYTLDTNNPATIARWRNARRTLVGGDVEIRELKPAGKKT